MSVPLEGLAIYDTDERISRARVMAEYRRHALEELNHIRTFQEQHPLHHCEADTAPGRLSAPKDTENEVPESVAKHPATPMLPGVTEKRLAAACATANNTTQTPRKPGSKIKSMFSRVPKKKPQCDFSDIRHAMGPEPLTHPVTGRPRTADPSAGGQLPGEDSWEWYQRNITALPPMPLLPPLSSPKPMEGDGVHPALRERVQD